MAHFALLWKARTIEKHRQNYENEKINSILMSNADIPEKTLRQRWRHYSYDVQKRLSRTFSRWYPEGSTMSNFLVNFRAEMRLPHILLRSLFGFVGGLMLTYLCFVFLVFQLSLSLVHATVMSSLFGVLITLGLTSSNRIRCLVFLLIAQLFSRAGRYTLTCYALVLILTGPATNTLKNSEVLSESMACSQEQIKTSVREINESLNKPFNSIKDSIKLMVEEMRLITMKLRLAIMKINKLILSIASLIQSSFSWLESIAQSCNRQLGTPYHRCIASLKSSVDSCQDCYDKAPWYYAATSVAKIACGVLKPYDKFCVASDFSGETFFATVRRKLKTFTTRINKVIFLKIHPHHSYTFVGNASSGSQVAAGIVTEIRNRADPILTWLSWSSCVTSLFLLLIIFRAKHYQHMYETRSRFDNRYITKEFRDLDLKRLREGRETVLPLSRRERAKYVTTTSFRLVASEKIYLNRSAVFMTITTFKLLIHIVADYSLYWVLMTIRYHGALQSPLEPGILSTGVHITGRGFVSRLLQSLLNTLNIPLVSLVPTSNSCLPNPHPPDFKRYFQIGILIFLLWFFALFEPYGLRLRHLIMGHYKTERAKTRAVWLYNHILRTRGSFMKFARRKLHREFKYSSGYKLTFRRWLRSLVPFQWLRHVLGIQLEDARCLLCNAVDYHDVNSDLIRCEVSNCPGTYCSSCFSDIGQMCTICLSPADYGDLSDCSLEKGSSDEDDDSYDKNDADDPNNENIGKTDSENDFKNKENISRYESDNESDYASNNKNIDFEMSPLLHHHNNNAKGKDDGKNKIKLFIDNAKNIANVNGNVLLLICVNVQCIDLSKPFSIAMDTNIVFNYNNNNPYVCYGFYRINVQNKSLFVTKNRKTSKLAKFLLSYKVARVRKKNNKKIPCTLVTCKNHKRGDTKKNKKKDKDKEKSHEEKSGKNPKNQNSKDNLNKTTNGDTTMKPRDDNVDKISICDINSKPRRIDSFHAKCSKYWKNISNALSCTDVTDTIKDLPAIEERKHKRKKKDDKFRNKEHLRKRHKTKDDNELARRYRISTYLADQDWKKSKMNVKIKEKCSLELQSIEMPDENEIEVNHIKIPRLNLCFSSESLNNKEENKVIMCIGDLSKRDIKGVKKKDLTTGALDRYFKRSRLSSVALNPSCMVLECQKKGRKSVDIANSDFSMPRSMKYFRSLGNYFDQKEAHESVGNESVLLRKSKTIETSAEPDYCQRVNNEQHTDNDMSGDEAKPKDANVKPKTIKFAKVNSKHSLEEVTKKWSNIKRLSSERCLGFGFKGPITIIKDLYTSLFTASNSGEDESKDEESKKGKADKEVAVYPFVQSCGCQKSPKVLKGEDRSIQVELPGKSGRQSHSKKICDTQVNAVQPTCTCATQYYTSRRDVGTLMAQDLRHDDGDCSQTVSSEDSVFSIDSESISIIKSDGTKTDTTVCSLATVDYQDERTKTENREKRKRIRVKVVTKANRSTLTERTNVCDVSTVTHDWWSPIVEKKECKKVVAPNIKEEDIIMIKKIEKRSVKSRGMTTDGRIVTFRSRAQIIPRGSPLHVEDILSPARYLLESQKYYNELFSTRFYSPHVFPVSHVLKHHKLESRLAPSSRHHSRRGRVTKKLEECCAPRKPATPRKKHRQSLKMPEITYSSSVEKVNRYLDSCISKTYE